MWQLLENGIVTVSPTLFSMGMNLLITAAAAEAKGPVTAAGSRQGFQDSWMTSLLQPQHTCRPGGSEDHWCFGFMGEDDLQAQEVTKYGDKAGETNRFL